MHDKTKDPVRFGVKIDRIWEDTWSLGICLTHWKNETYVYINLIRYSIAIGRMYMQEKENK